MNLLYSTGGVKIWPIMKSLYSVFAIVGAGESALVAGARWQTENWTFMTDLWWRGNVCHDVTNCHADVSRGVAVMCCDQGVGVTQQRTDQYQQITTRNWPQIASIFLAFLRHLIIIFALTLWTFGWHAQNECTQTVALIYENSVSYIWFTAWDGIPALVVRSNYKPAFWPGLDFYHRWVLSVLI